MAKIKGDDQENPWPIPSFHFLVKIDDQEIPFQEVSGLDTEHEVIEYRAGHSPEFSVIKTPNQKKGEITLKKGVFKADTALFDYFAAVKMNVTERKTITVSLIDQANAVVAVWTLKNAFPKAMAGASLNAKTNDADIEKIVLGHEGITMVKGG